MDLPFQRGAARQRYLPRTQVSAGVPVVLRLHRHRHVRLLHRPRVHAAAGDLRCADGAATVKEGDGAVGVPEVAEVRVLDGDYAVKLDAEGSRRRR